MAEEVEDQEEGKGKGPLLKIILFAVGGLLVLILTVVLTLFLSGFFDEEPNEEVEETLQQLEEQAETKNNDTEKSANKNDEESEGSGGDEEVIECEEGDEECEANAGAPKKVAREMPEPEAGFVQSYKELSRPLIANLASSRKVMQITLAVMTQYEEKVLENIDKHEFALRSVILDIMRQTKEEDITKPDFRVELAERIRLGMNSVLERWENFGGIEEVYFTEFVIQ